MNHIAAASDWTTAPAPAARPRGCRLSVEQVEAVRAGLRRGQRNVDIARELRVSRKSVTNIKHGYAYAKQPRPGGKFY
jgi:DNA-binding NarL/FixJ family response regulator